MDSSNELQMLMLYKTIICIPVILPDYQGINLFALIGVVLKLVEEGVEERNNQVHQRHHKGNQESLCLLEWRPAGAVCHPL